MSAGRRRVFGLVVGPAAVPLAIAIPLVSVKPIASYELLAGLVAYVGALVALGLVTVLIVDVVLRGLKLDIALLYPACGAFVGVLLLFLVLLSLHAAGLGEIGHDDPAGEPAEMPVMLSAILGSAAAGIYRLIAGRSRTG